MTPAQCRAARGLLKWTQDELARNAEVSALTVRNFENDKPALRATVAAIRRALEAGGVELTPDGGVRPREQPAEAKAS
jgi:transcriptional regulator with XRE-family HTH domain